MKHLLGVVSGCTIGRADVLNDIMNRVAERCEFNVVSRAFHQFDPQGATGVLVLAESHFSAHTYPENKKVYVDVFCCSADFDPKFCARVLEQEFGGSLEFMTVARA